MNVYCVLGLEIRKWEVPSVNSVWNNWISLVFLPGIGVYIITLTVGLVIIGCNYRKLFSSNTAAVIFDTMQPSDKKMLQ